METIARRFTAPDLRKKAVIACYQVILDAMTDYHATLRALDQLLKDTYSLWDAGWVTFNWRSYTYDHVQRVRGLTLHLGERERADLYVLELAALLHDITKPYDGEYVVDQQGKRIIDAQGYWRNQIRKPTRTNKITDLYDRLGLYGQLHNESGAIIAQHLLAERGFDDATCERVAQTIRDHLKPIENAPIESRCLYDADTLDANIGLPAFVRNIYINLHFHDTRKAPDAPCLETLLRDAPQEYMRNYINKLSGWTQGKERDFVPRMTTAAGREVALKRLARMNATRDLLNQEMADYATCSEHGCLAVVLHFMRHRDDPSIADETAYLAEQWLRRNGALPQAHEFIAQLQREAEGSA